MTVSPPRQLRLPCPILIGRSLELSTIEDELALASRGTSRCVVIAGEPGIGKSRLAREAQRLAAERGFAVLAGRCFPGDVFTPYAPFAEMLAELVRADPTLEQRLASGGDLSTLAPLLAPILNAGSPTPAPAGDGPLTEQFRRSLLIAWQRVSSDHAPGRPRLLVIDDLQWCDDGSLQLLLELWQRPSPPSSVILMTCRDEARETRLLHFFSELDRPRRITELHPGPFDLEQTSALLEGVLGHVAAVSVVRDLLELTDGNPFFLEEVLRSSPLPSASDAGSRTAGALPRSVLAFVAERVRQLGADARRLLVRAAAFGREFDASLLGELTGLPEDALMAALRELCAAHLIVEQSADRFSFRHALTREAVYSGLLARERRGLHDEIATALEARAASGGVGLQAALARHCFEAQRWNAALGYALGSAERAQSLHAYRSAREHWLRVFEVAAKTGQPLLPSWARALGLVHERLDEFDPARERYEQCIGLATAGELTSWQWQALLDLGRLWMRRDYAVAGSFYERALEMASRSGDPSMYATSLNGLGGWLLNTGRDAEAIKMHRSALELFAGRGDLEGEARTLERLGMSYGLAGDLPSSVEAFSGAIDRFRTLDEPLALANSLQGRAVFGSALLADTVASAQRPAADCLRDATESVDIARRVGVSSVEAFSRMGVTAVHCANDDFGPALAEAQATLRLASEAGHLEWAVGARWGEAATFVQMLAGAAARDMLAALLPDAERTGSAWWVTNTRAYLALANVMIRDVRAADVALAGFDVERSAYRGCGERRLAWAAAEVELARREPERALAIVDRLIDTAPSRHGSALLLRLRGEALLLARRFGGAVRALSDALALAVESGGLAALWRIQVALSRAWTHQQRTTEAEAEARAAAATLARLVARASAVGRDAECRAGAALLGASFGRAAARRQEAARFGGLSKREREVAVHIARGASNAIIANALHVSRRTVESHVESILAKLGFTGRAQVAVWAAASLGEDASG